MSSLPRSHYIYVARIIGTIFAFTDSLAASLGPVLVGWLSAWMGYATAYPTVDSPLTPELYAGTELYELPLDESQ